MLIGMRKLVLSIALLVNVCMVLLLLAVGYLHFSGTSDTVHLTDDGIFGLLFMLAMFGFSAVALAGLIFNVPRLSARLNDALAANLLLILFAAFVIISTIWQKRLDMLPGAVIFFLICLGNMGFLGIEKYFEKAGT